MYGTPTMEDNVINIDDIDTPIYRIFTLDRFTEIIKSRENGLVHPSKWDDPFENFFLKNNAQMANGEIVSLSSISESWYGQCWTKNKDSDAMWRIYSAGKTGVRVETTVRKLFVSFYDASDRFASLKYMIGSVEYKSRSEIESFLGSTTFLQLSLGGQSREFAKTLLIKRPEFEHENEVRLLFQDVDKIKGSHGVATFHFDWANILSEVALDPRLTESQFITEKQNLESLGCTIPITQSDLYKFTSVTVRFD